MNSQTKRNLVGAALIAAIAAVSIYIGGATIQKGGAPKDTPTAAQTGAPSATPKRTNTPAPASPSPIPASPTFTLVPPSATLVAPTNTKSAGPTQTAETPMPSPTTPPGGEIAPYRDAPLCPDSGAAHDQSLFHELWDADRGCHYDHEHGQNPFAPAVAPIFAPLGNLHDLTGGVGIGHTNPSGPMENTHKHGGFEWTVRLGVPCVPGFEAATNCVTDAVIQFHGFGDSRMELEVTDGARIHSVAAMVKMGPPSDPGYLWTVQHVEYGEICASYQGEVVPYPQNFQPEWDCAFGQYWTVPCFGAFSNCLPSIDDFRVNGRDADVIATTKRTGINSQTPGLRPPGSTLLAILWRGRDMPQAFDASDQEYPFTYPFICSADGGLTMATANCRYNNSTTVVHEIGGAIPEAWDTIDGADDGRVTYEGFVTRFGTLNPQCSAPGPDCHPVKMVNAYVGTYGGNLCPTGDKCSDTNPQTNPERDIYFCGDQVCAESTAGAVPSGWIGPNN